MYLCKMTNEKTEFEIAYEGDSIPVIVHEVEENDLIAFYVEIPGHEKFEIFLSDDDMWVTNDDVSIDEDLIFLIGDTFENLQP